MAASTRSRRAKESKENRRKVDSPDEEVRVLQPCLHELWAPSAYTAFKALLSARLCAAIWSNISDCDEVFNYWEPMHYILHGTGFQTWEYSPLYAIRSYAYLWAHLLPLKLYSGVLQAQKVLQFYFLRCVLAFCCSLCEVYFYKSICKQFGINTGRLVLAFLLFSTGMFISTAAFLPSTFAMYMTLTAMAGWFLGHYEVAIFSIAASTLIGWPFAAAIGLPIAYDIVINKIRVWFFIKWTLISLIVCLVPVVQIDSHYYGGLVITPLNIFLYNVLSDHGPDIYGVEPWHFYFMNGFLNFNVVFVMALISLPFTFLVKWLLKQPTRGIPIWLSLGAMYIWIVIFFTRPHKEERFLFPIYPLFCLAGAVTLDYCQKLYSYFFSRSQRQHYTESSNWISGLCVLGFALVSISRTLALFYGYHAPLEVYGEIHKIATDPQIHSLAADKHVNVCVGKEWYRYPSSFFFPDDKWHLQFIKSEFRGQLPKPFGKGPLATRKIPTHMNDMNKEEPSRYINITKCHYLIDLDVPRETDFEPRYSHRNKEWKVVASAKFLDAQRSHKFFRSFFIPFMSYKHCTYIDYNLLKTTRTRRTSTGKS